MREEEGIVFQTTSMKSGQTKIPTPIRDVGQ